MLNLEFTRCSFLTFVWCLICWNCWLVKALIYSWRTITFNFQPQENFFFKWLLRQNPPQLTWSVKYTPAKQINSWQMAKKFNNCLFANSWNTCGKVITAKQQSQSNHIPLIQSCGKRYKKDPTILYVNSK